LPREREAGLCCPITFQLAITDGMRRPMRFPQRCLRHVIQLRGEFFHCGIFADNFTSLSTVQSYLCSDGATESSLINIAKRPRHEASQPTDPGRGMSVADNDAGAKYGEAGKTDVAQ